MKVKNAFLYVLIGLSSFVNAQGDQPMRGPLNQHPNGVIDGVVLNEELPVSFVKPYEFVRSSDYVFSKRVYSRIDAREKINQSIFLPFDSFDGDEENGSLYNPSNVTDVDNDSWKRDQSNWSLWTVILRHILLGDLTVFKVGTQDSDLEDGYNLRYPVDKNPLLDKKDYFENKDYKNQIAKIISLSGPGDPLSLPSVSDGDAEPITFKKTKQTLSVFIDSLVKEDKDEYERLLGYPDLQDWWDAVETEETVKMGKKIMFVASSSIFAYNVKEDWYFDKELSVFEKRIICIAPVARYTYDPSAATAERGELLVYDKSGKAFSFDKTAGFEEYTDEWEEREMFWLYFPELRNVIVNYFVSNDKNDSDRMSFDELFLLRYYSGQIYKSSNRYDQEIQDYRHGVDALYEAEKFKDKMRNWEHDVWNF